MSEDGSTRRARGCGHYTWEAVRLQIVGASDVGALVSAWEADGYSVSLDRVGDGPREIVAGEPPEWNYEVAGTLLRCTCQPGRRRKGC